MRFKFHTMLLVSALVGLGLLSVLVFAARNWGAVAPATVGSIVTMPDAPDEPDPPPSEPMPAAVPDDWGFSLNIPEGWVVTDSNDDERIHSELIEGWIASGVPENAFGGDLSVSTITVMNVAKDGRSFTDVVDGYVWVAGDVQEIVAFMREEAGDLFPDFSEKDVLISAAVDTVGGSAAMRATRQCLKPCYIEGGAVTSVRYIIDAPDVVYVLEVSVGTSPNAADLLNAADAVVRTFALR